jgi:hypothetical protein
LVEGADDEESLRAEVEITLARNGGERTRVMQFDSSQTGPVRLGAHVEDVDITVPQTDVVIGPGSESVLVAPISIQCAVLSLMTEKVIVECPSQRQASAVFLEAGIFDGAEMVSVPVVRGNVSLAAYWPGVQSHPWTSFATSPTQSDDPRLDEALRRLRKFVIAFRSHSRGRLARFKGKIEHARMTKGTGRAVLKHMLSEGILTLEGPMYFLDPDRLMQAAGITYADCMSRRFSPETLEFLRQALVVDS